MRGVGGVDVLSWKMWRVGLMDLEDLGLVREWWGLGLNVELWYSSSDEEVLSLLRLVLRGIYSSSSSSSGSSRDRVGEGS